MSIIVPREYVRALKEAEEEVVEERETEEEEAEIEEVFDLAPIEEIRKREAEERRRLKELPHLRPPPIKRLPPGRWPPLRFMIPLIGPPTPSRARVGKVVNPRLKATPVPTPEPFPKTLKECLSNVPIMEVIVENWVKKRVVLVGDNQNVETTLVRLNRHRVHALPVLDESTGDFIGMIDTMDILAHLNDVFDPAKALGGYSRWAFLFKSNREVLEMRKHKYIIIANHASLYEGLVELTQQGIYRLMVTESKDDVSVKMGPIDTVESVEGLLTQFDIIRFIGEHPDWMNTVPACSLTVQQLDLGIKDVISVRELAPTFEGFQILNESGQNAIAVVDAYGRLVANLSSSDVRGIRRNNFQALYQSVYDFFAKDKRRGWWQLPICVKESMTLKEVIMQFCATHVHQMYTIDEDGRPIRVISLDDVLKALIKGMENL